MKSISVLLSAVLITAISIAAIAIVLFTGLPAIERSKEALYLSEAKTALTSIDNALRTVLSEGQGSSRAVPISVSAGQYLFDSAQDRVLFEMEQTSKIVERGIFKKEGNLYISTGADVSASGNSTDLTLENSRILIIINKTGSSSSYFPINTSALIKTIRLKELGNDLNLSDTQLYVDSVGSTYTGTGHTYLPQTGENLREASAIAFMRASGYQYEIHYTLRSNADFLLIEVKNANSTIANYTVYFTVHLGANKNNDILNVSGLSSSITWTTNDDFNRGTHTNTSNISNNLILEPANNITYQENATSFSYGPNPDTCFSSPLSANDRDWFTSGYGGYGACSGFYYFYWNYTRPSEAHSTIWQTKTNGLGLRNDTLPYSCFIQDPIQVRIGSPSSGTNNQIFCYDGTTWLNLDGSAGSREVYEEGMYWNATYKPSGSYTSNTTNIGAIGSLTATWNMTNATWQQNITVELSTDGATWLLVSNNTQYTSGYGSGSNLRWRANFSTDNTSLTPYLHDLTVSYSSSAPVSSTDLCLYDTSEFSSPAFFALTSESMISGSITNYIDDYRLALNSTQEKAYLSLSKGVCDIFRKHKPAIWAKTFLEPLKALSYAFNNTLQLVLKYVNVDILSDLQFGKGSYNVYIENTGYNQTSGKRMIDAKILK